MSMLASYRLPGTPNRACQQKCFNESLCWARQDPKCNFPKYQAVYASRNNVILVDNNFRVVALIPLRDEIRAIGWCPLTGKIAVATPKSIYVYVPILSSNQWHQILSFDVLIPVSDLTWLGEGSLVVAVGSHLRIWDVTTDEVKMIYEKVVKYQIVRVTSLVDRTPGHNEFYFASVSVASDRVHACYFNSETSTLTPAKLLHKNQVSLLDWYPYCSEHKCRILATLCTDGIVRIWRDPVVGPEAVEKGPQNDKPSQVTDVNSSVQNLKRDPKTFSLILTLQFGNQAGTKCRGFSWCSHLPTEKIEEQKISDADLSSSHKKDVLVWILSVDNEGTFYLWCIENLIYKNQGIPKLILFHTLQCSAPIYQSVCWDPESLVQFELTHCRTTFYDPTTSSTTSPPARVPSENLFAPFFLEFYGFSRDSTFQHWSLRLNERLPELSHIIGGHSDPSQHITRHVHNIASPIMGMVDASGEFSLWNCPSSQLIPSEPSHFSGVSMRHIFDRKYIDQVWPSDGSALFCLYFDERRGSVDVFLEVGKSWKLSQVLRLPEDIGEPIEISATRPEPVADSDKLKSSEDTIILSILTTKFIDLFEYRLGRHENRKHPSKKFRKRRPEIPHSDMVRKCRILHDPFRGNFSSHTLFVYPGILWAFCGTSRGDVLRYAIHAPKDDQDGDWSTELELVMGRSHSDGVRKVQVCSSTQFITSTGKEVWLWESESMNKGYAVELAFDIQNQMVSYCSLGDGRLRFVTAYRSINSLTLHAPMNYGIEPASDKWRHINLTDLLGPIASKDPRKMRQREEKTEEKSPNMIPHHAFITAISLTPGGSLFVSLSDRSTIIVPTKIILERAGKAAIPAYHPSFLIENMKNDNFDRIATIFSHMHHYLMKNLKKEANRKEELERRINVPNDSPLLKPVKLGEIPLIPLKFLLTTENEGDRTEHVTISTQASLLDYEAKNEISYEFGERTASELSTVIQEVDLPYLSSYEKGCLLTLIDSFNEIKRHQRALDVPGAKFLLSVKLYKFFRKTIEDYELPSRDHVWAMHSDSQESLIDLCFPDEDMEWSYLRALGVGYWIHNVEKLRSLIERMARQIFMRHKEPKECLLWYLILNRKATLLGLFKAAKNQRMYEFMSHNFTVKRWNDAAIKNAYAALSKRNFGVSVSFFILSGKLEDAANICCNQMKDPQLGLLIWRLMRGDSTKEYDGLLSEKFLPFVSKPDASDPWKQHIGLWLLRRPDEAVKCLLVSEPKSRKQLCPDLASFLSFLQTKSVKTKAASTTHSSSSIFASFAPPSIGDPSMAFNPNSFGFGGGFGSGMGGTASTVTTSAWAPENYSKCFSVVTNQALGEVIRCSAYSYAASGLPILALEELHKITSDGEPLLGILDDEKSPQSQPQPAAMGSPSFPGSPSFQQKTPAFDMGAFGGFGGFGNVPMLPPLVQQKEEKEETKAEEDEESEESDESDGIVHSDAYHSLISHLIRMLLAMRTLERSCLYTLSTAHQTEQSIEADIKFLESYDVKFVMDYITSSSVSFSKSHRLFQQLLGIYANKELSKPLSKCLNNELITLCAFLDHLDVIEGLSESDISVLVNATKTLVVSMQRILYLLLQCNYKDAVQCSLEALIKCCAFILFLYTHNWHGVELILDGDISDDIVLNAILHEIDISSSGVIVHRAQDDEEVEEEYRPMADNVKTILEALSRETLIFLALQKFAFDFQNQFEAKHGEGYSGFRPLMCSLLNWLDRASVRVIRLFNEGMVECSYKSRRNISDWLSPLTSPSILTPRSEDLCQTLKFKHTLEQYALQIKTYFLEHLISEEDDDNFWHPSREIFKSEGLPLAVAVNQVESRYVAIASEIGIREINVISSLKFRKRTTDQRTLLDNEFDNWEGCLHRFDQLEQVDRESKLPGAPNQIILPIKLSEEKRNSVDIQPQKPIRKSSSAPTFSTMADTAKPELLGSAFNEPFALKTLQITDFTKEYVPQIGNVKHDSSTLYQEFALNQDPKTSTLDRSHIALALASHPTLPLYVSGNASGQIHLWHFARPRSLMEFKTSNLFLKEPKQTAPPTATEESRFGDLPITTPKTRQKTKIGLGDRITRLNFNSSGSRVGATGDNGNFGLWALTSPLVPPDTDVVYPYQTFQCHLRSAADFAFINEGSYVATAGVGDSQDKRNVCVWDTLMPFGSNLMIGYECHESATAICFLPNQQLLVSGGTRGQINILDYRRSQIVKTLDSKHSGKITRLQFVPNSNQFISIGQDGCMKVWDICILQSFMEEPIPVVRRKIQVDVIDVISQQICEKRTIFKHQSRAGMMSSFGLTDLVCSSNGDVFVSGADGTVKYFKHK